MSNRDAARIPGRDEHQARIDHATWINQRKAKNRCICLTCWAAHLAGRIA